MALASALRGFSEAPDYWAVCTRNHLEAKKNGELIIRVLVLPGHIECCTKPIIEWVAKNLGTETRVNIMVQYRPKWRANEILELQRQLSKDEMEKTARLAEEARLANFMT
jgi:putative pyruvate formate lyase activating enzyme